MGWGSSTWMDIETGDIYVKQGDESGGGIFRIPGKGKDE